jgi:Icc protein
MATSSFRVAQLSDLHFSSDGTANGRETGETFAAVAADVLNDAPDLVVVTGDIADTGQPGEYEVAGEALAALGLPVYCLPGNHDRVDEMHAFLPRPGVVVQRSLRVREWLFLFGDSNDEGVVFDADHGWVDHDDRMELARGAMHDHEQSWLRRQLEQGSAAQAMLWLHHPPAAPGMFSQPEYDAKVADLVGLATPVAAMAAGHVHTHVESTLARVPVYLCPSTGTSLDFDESRMMPPGYRRFTFHDDGRVDTEVVWIDDERWNKRYRLPDWAIEYLAGELSQEEMERRQAEMMGGNNKTQE